MRLSNWLHLGLCMLAGQASALSGSKFRFKLNQLYEVSIGLENMRGTPAAFGDFYGTQQTDLFVISPDQQTVELWEWQSHDKNFAHKKSADIHIDGMKISNIVPGDFDMDGNLDLLVQASAKTEQISMLLYLGDGTTGFTAAGELPSAVDALPFAFDYGGTGRVDFLGASWDQKSNASAPTWVWTNKADGSTHKQTETTALPNDETKRDAQVLFELQPFVPYENSTKMCQPASPHSSAFVDLDGDCLADLFIVCQGNEEYQIWLNSGTGFVYSQTGKLPSSAGPVSFADMNADGSLDMVIPILGKPQIHIVYNQQRPLCVGARKQEGCRKFKHICEGDSEFSFSVTDAHVIDITDMWHNEVLLDKIDDFQGQAAPPAVKIGDFNLDGYPDLAIVTKKGKESRVRLLKSEPCDACKAGKDGLLDRRSYVSVTDGVAALEQFSRVQDIAFFDVDGTGTLDLLIYFIDKAGKKRTSCVYNNFFTDAFFIKAMACPSDKVRSYSAYLSGPSFKYLLVSDTGKKHVAQSAQIPQTAYRALFTPYTVIGIGRTNNYIEDFSVGSTSALGHHVKSFEGLIPNSQVVVFPVNTTSDWRLELYMNRSESTPYILATLLSTMGVLAITVFVLSTLERKADMREKQRALHAINFDAL
ncbi:hypothetical protein GGH12_005725 [Coemansia sp. RSA 1822]|nr:hypothetical protein LPJ76_005663 [Coemansia sp. RSA 638]KAJ2538843.1 hypothetical protein GGF49_005643 [Coemansia sp. RSA 1853]KAJ2558727.1 hypothetical protein GGH12_005725 [Coemansia sp. RSA 1822]